ncbi:hypothetical protein SBFV2_gp25 [Sulfolobales Beppu filamentous virus 2]|uniref:Uncharacterized protein n=1 Tax=Sulfolobales Beppu filamentous virus 2 TaxID=2493123 RepID=A0A3S8NEY9_9VIRU|nr:hypothetical protein HOU84_gp25 [Sulfolobales Beppu filamentous virus 2]AZI75792.1 hypothetical protein SBFV2_gp25 [Sulfolobales Beppu filamentous virus 2]
MRSKYDFRSSPLFYTAFATIYALKQVTGQDEFTIYTDYLIYQIPLKSRIRRIIRHGAGTKIFIGDSWIETGKYYIRYPGSKKLLIPTIPPTFVIDSDEDYVLVIP